jgi:hypothetical protein
MSGEDYMKDCVASAICRCGHLDKQHAPNGGICLNSNCLCEGFYPAPAGGNCTIQGGTSTTGVSGKAIFVDVTDNRARPPITAAETLDNAAHTYRERNAVYGDNFRMVGPIMKVLFPKGVPVALLGDDSFHLFELVIVKLTRFAISDLTHRDSIHDAAVYAAMIEANIYNKETDV